MSKKEDKEFQKVIEAKKFLEARGYEVNIKPPEEWKITCPVSLREKQKYEH